MSLRTGTEMIALALLFNKVTGVYGLLAVLTGYHLSVLQLSLYVYSVLALGLLACCLPHIRRQTPFHNLALAWLYIVDTVTNTAYTSVFAVNWFLALQQGGPKPAEPTGKGAPPPPPPPMDGVASVAGAIDTTTSMVLIVLFTLIRVYFTFVVMAYARSVLLQHREATGHEDGGSRPIDSPFAAGLPDGEGWKGKLGRAMVSVGRGYWLPSLAERAAWERSVSSRFRGKHAASA